MSRLCTDDRETIVKRLLTAKELSQKTYDTIAQQVGMTNVMVGQIFHRQAQLKEYAVDKMKRAVPLLSDSDIFEMCKPPFRSYDPLIIQEPTIYRLNEVCMHFGKAHSPKKLPPARTSASPFSLSERENQATPERL